MRARLAAAALAFAAVAAAGCGAAARLEDRPRVAERAIYIAPIRVEPDDGAAERLAEGDLLWLRAEILKGLADLARRDEKAKREPLLVADTPEPATRTVILDVKIDRFDPHGSTALALAVGLGAGRPAWRAHFRLGGSAGESLGSREFSRRSSRYRDEDAPARAMLTEIADAAVAFVRRRR